jgi:hypothetical protein
MHEHKQPRTTDVVDKKGMAVALLFLIAMAIWAVERTGEVSQLQITWQKLPPLTAHFEIRPVRTLFDAELGRHFIQSPDFSSHEQAG